MEPETVRELRNQFNNIVDVLESEGFCTSRECMCDTSAPIVKMNAAITELEQDIAAFSGIEVWCSKCSKFLTLEHVNQHDAVNRERAADGIGPTGG